MWMLVRADALGNDEVDDAGRRVLAACPDTAERGDPWRWSVNLEDLRDHPRATVDTDDSYVVSHEKSYTGNQSETVIRRAGEVLVVAALTGEALVAVTNGPWERWIRPGDVFVLEGEDDEELRISLAGGDSSTKGFLLSPVIAHALRWVP